MTVVTLAHPESLAIREKAAAVSVTAEEVPGKAIVYGKSMRDVFLLDPGFRNFNNGSFGTIPRAIQAKLRSYQDQAEARPDPFIRYDQPRLLDESRAAIAAYLNVHVDTCVFVPNATTGVNTVLRNLTWSADGADEILYFDTIYSGCGKTVDYIVDTRDRRVDSRAIPLTYPCEDAVAVAAFEAAVRDSRAAGRRPRVCIVDTVSSLPGVRFPFAPIVAACRAHGILSLVDGAQGVGMIALDLAALDPDFFVSNCHKWLHVPRGCAVFYVPLRHQALMRSAVPTSHGYVPLRGERFNPLPPTTKSAFVNNFEFVGTLDCAPYLCVKDSIAWRRDVLGGEDRICAYLWELAKEGGRRVAEILGTEVMENSTGTLTNCGMVNVALPLGLGPDSKFPQIPHDIAPEACNWMLQTFMDEYNTFIVVYVYHGRWWTRLSAQVYLDTDDFEWAGKTLKEVCERTAKMFGKDSSEAVPEPGESSDIGTTVLEL